MQIQLAESGGRVRHILWCSKLSCWLCQQATTDLRMESDTITMIELGWVLDITIWSSS